MTQEEIARLEEQVKTLFNDVCDLKGEIRDLSQKLDQYVNRLPVWATVVISILTAACGWLGAIASR